MRASTGKAVTLSAIPMNSANGTNAIASPAKAGYSHHAEATPIRKASSMVPWLITTAVVARCRAPPGSRCMPTTNMNRINPIWLSVPSAGSEAGGNRNAPAAGHDQPSTEGPSTMPAAISTTTRGCPKGRKALPIRRVKPMITTICMSSRISGSCNDSVSRELIETTGGAVRAIAVAEFGGP